MVSLKLKELRKENKYTLKDIANLLDISISCYSNWEQGIREPNIDMLVKISSLYNISVDYIVGLEDENGCKIKNNIVNSFNNNKGNINFRG